MRQVRLWSGPALQDRLRLVRTRLVKVRQGESTLTERLKTLENFEGRLAEALLTYYVTFGWAMHWDDTIKEEINEVIEEIRKRRTVILTPEQLPENLK